LNSAQKKKEKKTQHNGNEKQNQKRGECGGPKKKLQQIFYEGGNTADGSGNGWGSANNCPQCSQAKRAIDCWGGSMDAQVINDKEKKG